MILCCGEALIDMLPRRVESGETGFMPVPGGAIYNTAIALGRLGEEAGFFSSVSTDMFGEQLIEFLHHSNVQSDTCVRIPNPTTLAFVKLTNGQAQYSFFDENSALRSLEQSTLPSLPEMVSTLHFGAISLVSEPCGSAYEAFMAQNEDRVISLDPNIRESFIKNEEQHRSRIERMVAMSDIVKVSDEDLAWISNGTNAEEKIASWLEGRAKIVLLTKDAEGAIAYTRNGRIQQPAMKVEVVDSIGAGDTFNAGFLSGLARQGLLSKNRLSTVTMEELRPALELAAKVAAKTVSRAGANPPWKSEL